MANQNAFNVKMGQVTRSPMHQFKYGLSAMLGIALMGGAQTTNAALVSPCTGVSLPQSVITDIVGQAVVPLAGTLDSVLNDIILAPIVGPILGPILGVPTLQTDLQGTLGSIAGGAPINLNVLDVNGDVVNNAADCTVVADVIEGSGENGVSIGGNQVTGLGDPGRPASAGEINSIAIGNSASTDPTAERAIAIGDSASVGLRSSRSLAIGNMANVGDDSPDAVAIGNMASVGDNSANATSLGSMASVGDNSANSTALGSNASVANNAPRATAIGSNAEVNAADSTAIGFNAQADATNSVAIGANSVANEADTVSVGSAGSERKITNVAAGSNPTDAVNFSQAVTYDQPTGMKMSMTLGGVDPVTGEVNQGGGEVQIRNLADGVAPTDAVNKRQLDSSMANVNNQIGNLRSQINRVERDANAGIAGAMAMASLPQSVIPGKGMIAGGVANYEGQSAVAIGVSKFSDNGRWVMNLNGSANTRGNVGGGVGFGMHW